MKLDDMENDEFNHHPNENGLFMDRTLTPKQCEAVQSEAANILVIAGAGSGKTRTLVRRIVRRAASYPPEGFAAISFTNAAANELAERLAKSGVKVGFCGTLHSLMIRLLSRHGHRVGVQPGFAVIDEDQTESLLDQVATEGRYKKPMKALREVVAGWETRVAKKTMTEAETMAAGFFNTLRRENLLTFDQVLKRGLDLLARPGVWPYTHLFVDEVQDSGDVDIAIYAAAPAGFKFYVGDVAQAIYSFRGGRVRHIMQMTTFADFHVIRLAENFRSCREIVETANRIQDHMDLPKVVAPMDAATGAPGIVQRWEVETGEREIVMGAEWLKTMMAGPEPVTAAVLLRTNPLVQEWAKGLEDMGLRVRKRTRQTLPVDWKAVKDYLALLANPDNDRLAYLAICHSRGEEVAGKARTAALAALTSINQLCLQFPRDLGLADAPAKLAAMGAGPESLDRIRLAAAGLPEGAGLAELLIALSREDVHGVEEGEGIVCTTIHSAKGREFDVVLMPAMEQGILPLTRAELAEERRVAYVGVTRARLALGLSWAAKRRNKWANNEHEARLKSVFLTEMEP